MKIINVALSLSLLVISAAVYAAPTSGIPNFTDVAKDGDGHTLFLNIGDAIQYCQKMGDRLPTTRELALWATQYGSKVSDTPQAGFDEIQGTDSAYNSDTFYYQHSGYKAPTGEFGRNSFWSSSWIPRYLPSDSPPSRYDLIGNDGSLFAFSCALCGNGNGVDEYNAVMCVQSH